MWLPTDRADANIGRPHLSQSHPAQAKASSPRTRHNVVTLIARVLVPPDLFSTLRGRVQVDHLSWPGLNTADQGPGGNGPQCPQRGRTVSARRAAGANHADQVEASAQPPV